MAKLNKPKFEEEAEVSSPVKQEPAKPEAAQTGFPKEVIAIKDFKGQFNKKSYRFKAGESVLVPDKENYLYLKSFKAVV